MAKIKEIKKDGTIVLEVEYEELEDKKLYWNWWGKELFYPYSNFIDWALNRHT